jgi:hypothetical protein
LAGKVKAGGAVMRVLLWAVVLAAVVLSGCASWDTTAQPDPVLGLMERSQLPESYRTVYDTVTIQADVIALLRIAGQGVETKVFLGTWCPDSRREVPRFLKVVDALGTSLGPVVLIGLDRRKKSPEGFEIPYNVERVPTFVFLRKGKEIGRVVEIPQTTIEADMLTIAASSANQ